MQDRIDLYRPHPLTPQYPAANASLKNDNGRVFTTATKCEMVGIPVADKEQRFHNSRRQ